MKIILAGSWRYNIYHSTLATALERAGATVIPFKTFPYLGSKIGRLEAYACMRGAYHYACESAFKALCRKEQPDVVFVWNYDMLSPAAINVIRNSTNAKMVCYTNDDPFSNLYKSHSSLYVRRRWANYHRTLPLYDHHFVFREINVGEFLAAGAISAEVLRMYFNPEMHYPREPSAQWSSDVVFIGHFENDIRKPSLLALKKRGINVRIHGQYGWDKPEAAEIAKAFGHITPVWGEDYNSAISGAKIALCFLSRLNRDEYTTRSLEIPACGALLMAERTPTHQKLYKEGEEAEFFSSPEELVEKATSLLYNPDKLKEMAEKGRQRVLHGGHTPSDRAAQILSRFTELVSRHRS